MSGKLYRIYENKYIDVARTRHSLKLTNSLPN